MRTVFGRPRRHLHVRGIRASLAFGEREGAKLFAVHELRQPFLFLLVRSKEQQRPNADGMMRVDENGGRRTAAADFFQHFAIRHLGKTAAAVIGRRSHPEHSHAPETVNYLARNFRLSIYCYRIELVIEKLAQFRKRLVQLRLLCCRNSRIRQHPIGHEVTLEKTFRKT